MRTPTPYTAVEALYELRRTENIDLLERKFKDLRGVNIYESAIDFNKYRQGVIDYFSINNQEVITSVDYPDLLPDLSGYHYDNNLNELQGLGFKKHTHKFAMFYSRPIHTSIQSSNYDLKYNIIIPALFKNESNEWLEWYFNYYRRQGVDRFFMHYNGCLKDRPNLPRYKDVEYIEWNIPLLSCRVHNVNWYDLAHIQVALFSLIAKKYIPQSKYTLAIDVDELLYTPDDRSLYEYLEDQKFNNKKCGIRVASRFTSIDFEANTFNIKNMTPCLNKLIYSNYYKQYPFILIHHKCFNVIEDDNILQMAHITNHKYCGPARTIQHSNRFHHLYDKDFTTINIK